MIPKSKTGDCTKCPKKNTAVRKRGRELICLSCCKKMDAKKQLDKKFSRHIPTKKTGAAEIARWFADRRKEMKGYCSNCGGRTLKYDENKYHYCIAHILPKAYFKSVATHPDNWVELCFYGKSCHTNLDNGMIDLIELSCWNEIVEKFVRIYPHIAQEEKRRIPAVLLQYVEVEK